MSKPQSLYLTARTMSALRPDDSLGPRMNQIVDRYIMMIEESSENVRRMFDAEEWEKLIASCPYTDIIGTAKIAFDVRSELIGRIGAWPELARHVKALDGGEFVTLLELLEGDRIGRELLAGLENLSSAPSSVVEGKMYRNTTDNMTYVYNGTAWVVLPDAQRAS